MSIGSQNTNLDYQFVKLYLKEIGPLNMLTSSEEQRLIVRIKEGDKEAFDQLIIRSQYMVLEEVLYFIGKGHSTLDLIQNANLACTLAIKRYESNKGNLKNYLHHYIYRILHNITTDFYTIVRIPLNILSEVRQLCNELNECERFFPRELSQNDFHEILNDKSVSRSVRNFFTIKAVDGNIKIIPKRYEENLDKIPQETFCTPDENITNESLKEKILRVLNTLSKRESEVIKLYYGLEHENPYTFQEIGNKFNLTRERVRQIKEDAVSKLKHHSRANPLSDCLSLICPESQCFDTLGKCIHLGLDNRAKAKAIELIEQYIEPQRRKTPYPNIQNISERCRKLIISILEERNKPCTYDFLKDLVYEKLPLLNPGSFDYAISNCDAVTKIKDNLYALKEWDYFESPRKKTKKPKRNKDIRRHMVEYLKEQTRPVDFETILVFLKDKLSINRLSKMDEKKIYNLLLKTDNVVRTLDKKFYYIEE